MYAAKVARSVPRASTRTKHQLAVTHQLDQLQGNVRRRFAAEDGWPSAARIVSSAQGLPGASSISGPQAGTAFQWGDAGIGAAGAIVLLSAGALATGVTRRRRVHGAATS